MEQNALTPGWYPSDREGFLRYFDGSQWTVDYCLSPWQTNAARAANVGSPTTSDCAPVSVPAVQVDLDESNIFRRIARDGMKRPFKTGFVAATVVLLVVLLYAMTPEQPTYSGLQTSRHSYLIGAIAMGSCFVAGVARVVNGWQSPRWLDGAYYVGVWLGITVVSVASIARILV
ncbi:MAG TPA: DUF2510 domain-containing protein [Actinomycetes bacterium]|nr:DUF2510 domain-containing protein [Actinomycetes bacterium]